MNRNRLGFIEVSEDMLISFWKNNIMFVPLEIENLLACRVTRYLCYSPLFRKLEISDSIPTYHPTYKKGLDNEIILEHLEEK